MHTHLTDSLHLCRRCGSLLPLRDFLDGGEVVGGVALICVGCVRARELIWQCSSFHVTRAVEAGGPKQA